MYGGKNIVFYPPIYPPVNGSTALGDLGRFFSFLIYTQSVRVLWLGISPPQDRYLHTQDSTKTEETHRHIHASSGTRTQDLSFRASEDSSCLRPRGHCDRRDMVLRIINLGTRRRHLSFFSLGKRYWYPLDVTPCSPTAGLEWVEAKSLPQQGNETRFPAIAAGVVVALFNQLSDYCGIWF
jgi:hypothetical protein